MALAKLKKIFVFTSPAHQEQLLKSLQNCGRVHVVNDNRLLPDEAHSFFAAPANPEMPQHMAGLEKRLVDLQWMIAHLEKREKPQGFISQFIQPKELTSSQDFERLEEYDDKKLLRRLQELEETGESLQKRIRHNQYLITQLLAVSGLSIPLEDIKDTAKTFVCLASISSRDWTQLEPQLQELLGDESLLTVLTTPHQTTIVLAVARKAKQTLFKTWIENQPVELLQFDGLSGAPAENIRALQKEIMAWERQIAEIEAGLQELVIHLPSLRQMHDYCDNKLERLRKSEALRQSRYLSFVSGWIREQDVPMLETRLAKSSFESSIVTMDPEPQDEPPVEYHNPPMAQPFQFVTDLYSRPKYWEIDPTPYLGAFFAFFVGICLTDAGYGLLLTLVTFLTLKRLAPSAISSGGRNLLRILLYCGIATTVVGFFTGGIFGFAFDELPGGLRRLQQFVIFNPLTEQMQFLIFTLALGVVHVLVGISLRFYRRLKQGQIAAAWLDQMPWLAILLGAVSLAIANWANMAWLNAIAYALMLMGAAVILLFAGRSSRNPFARLGAGLYSLYQVSGLFGDILSYVRLFALGLATGVIAGVVNVLAGLTLEIPYAGFVLMPFVLVSGHLLNIVINTLGGFIHTARLHFVEFFGKFYEGGGEPFEPFQLRLQYTQINDREL
jgi:V/A-type H+-transporting ATPase subunit I